MGSTPKYREKLSYDHPWLPTDCTFNQGIHMVDISRHFSGIPGAWGRPTMGGRCDWRVRMTLQKRVLLHTNASWSSCSSKSWPTWNMFFMGKEAIVHWTPVYGTNLIHQTTQKRDTNVFNFSFPTIYGGNLSSTLSILEWELDPWVRIRYLPKNSSRPFDPCSKYRALTFH
jgi:hypothetical protein